MKGIAASFLGMFVMACSGCGGGGPAVSTAAGATAKSASAPAPASAPIAASAATIPETDYQAIAQATLPASANPDQLSSRVLAVKQFIASNGGDVIYQGYLAKFGVPSDPRITSVAETVGLNGATLGHYYLHPPLAGGANTVAGPCSPLAISKGPTQKAQCALAEWDAYLATDDTSYRTEFLTWAQYFVQQSNNGQIQWATDEPAVGMKAPWISAMTQSQVISVLLRAYQCTGDANYLNTAQQAYYWLTIPASQGGTQLAINGGTWLEEYPNVSNPSSVLNGHMWALFGVWDYYRVTGDASALALFQSGIAALKVQIPAWFDLGYWNVYSHLNQVDDVTGLYMQFITQQMYVLNAITGDPFFKTLGDKWLTDQQTDALFVHSMAQAFLQANPALAAN